MKQCDWKSALIIYQMIRPPRCLQLKGVQLSIKTKCLVASVEAVLEYHNDTNSPGEVEFVMPMESVAVVTGLSAQLEGRTVRGVVRRKDKSKDDYDDTVSSGQITMYGERNCKDMFRMLLGNLPAGGRAELKLSMVQEMQREERDEGPIKFSLPATLKSNYRITGTPLANSTVEEEYKLSVTIRVEYTYGLSRMESPSHLINPIMLKEGVWRIYLINAHPLEKEFILLMYPSYPAVPSVLWADPIPFTQNENPLGSNLHPFSLLSPLMVSYLPQFCREEMGAGSEIIFMVDRSASMRGYPITSGKATLKMMLRSLFPGCAFNVVEFGTKFKFLFPDGSRYYDDESLKKATEYVTQIEADMSETKMLPPLVEIFRLPELARMSREVIILTNGTVNNTKMVLRCLREYRDKTRVFVIGIGTDASSELVNGIAEAGGGRSLFIREGEQMQDSILKLLRDAMNPCLTDVELKVPRGMNMFPSKIPRLFPNDRLIMYGLVDGGISLRKNKLSLSYKLKGKLFSHQLSLDSSVKDREEANWIHKLACRRVLREWEQTYSRRSECVQLSCDTNLVCLHTGLVGIDAEGGRVIHPIQPAAYTKSKRDNTPSHQIGTRQIGTSMTQAESLSGVIQQSDKQGITLLTPIPKQSPAKVSPTPDYEKYLSGLKVDAPQKITALKKMEMRRGTCKYGLLTHHKLQAPSCIPLKSVCLSINTKCMLASVEAVLEYYNDTSSPVEVEFVMPMESVAVVTGLSAQLEGRTVRGVVREKEEAKDDYDDAVSSGQTAIYGEQKGKDMFRMLLGNLPAGGTAELRLSLLQEMQREEGDEGPIRFSLPTTLKPRYCPTGTAGADIGDTFVEAKYELSVAMRVEYTGGVSRVESPSHLISTGVLEGGVCQVQLVDPNPLEKDFVAFLYPTHPTVPSVLWGRPTLSIQKETPGASKLHSFSVSPALMLSFMPQFTQEEREGGEVSSEIIFMTDRSGSMRGEPIASARATLELLIRSLSPGCAFNVVGFGTMFRMLFPDGSRRYDAESLKKATEYASKMKSDMLGTQILPPLEEIFRMRHESGLSLQVIILTDGAVANTREVLMCVRNNRNKGRVFAIGIGSGVSTELVRGMAEAGGGRAVFVKEGERMQGKILRLLSDAMSPCLTDVELNVPKGIHLFSNMMPQLFPNDRLVVYGFVDASLSLSQGHKLYLSYKLKDKLFSHELSLDFSEKDGEEGDWIHKLACSSVLREWEQTYSRRSECVQLSCDTNLVCLHTSLVGVDTEGAKMVERSMKHLKMKAPQPYRDCLSRFPRVRFETNRSSSGQQFCSHNTMKATSIQPLNLGCRILSSAARPSPSSFNQNLKAPISPTSLSSKFDSFQIEELGNAQKTSPQDNYATGCNYTLNKVGEIMGSKRGSIKMCNYPSPIASVEPHEEYKDMGCASSEYKPSVTSATGVSSHEKLISQQTADGYSEVARTPPPVPERAKRLFFSNSLDMIPKRIPPPVPRSAKRLFLSDSLDRTPKPQLPTTSLKANFDSYEVEFAFSHLASTLADTPIKSENLFAKTLPIPLCGSLGSKRAAIKMCLSPIAPIASREEYMYMGCAFSEFKPSVTSATGVSPHEQLISQQTAEGYWEVGETVSKLLNLSEIQKEACPKGMSEREWITLLCLITLEKYTEFEDEWKLVVKKGWRWLRGCQLSVNLEEATETARKAVK